MSAHGLEPLPEVLNQYAPDLLVLIYGGNDLLGTNDQEKARGNLEARLRLTTARDIPVVMLDVPAHGLILSSPHFYADLAARASALDTKTLPAILSNASLKFDLIYPNAEGCRMTTNAVFRLLADHGAL
jgi:acyl-CoA thioesterase I